MKKSIPTENFSSRNGRTYYRSKRLTRIVCCSCKQEDYLSDVQLSVFKNHRCNRHFCLKCFWLQAGRR